MTNTEKSFDRNTSDCNGQTEMAQTETARL